MAEKKCVAYVSTYTMGDKHGIKIYDVDLAFFGVKLNTFAKQPLL